MSRNGSVRILLFLLPCAVAAYGGPRIGQLGFYHDDWAILSAMHFAPPGWIGAIRGLIEHLWSHAYFRPLGIPLWPGLYAVFGLHPLGWQVASLAVNALLGLAAFRLATRFSAPEGMAAASAMLFLAYPAKDATLYWPIAIVNPLSLLLFLEGYLLHLDFAATGRRSRIAVGLLCLLLSIGMYDQTVLAFPLWLLVPSDSAEQRGRARYGFLAAGVLSAAYVACKLFVIPHWAGPFGQPLSIGPARLKVYWAGLASVFGPSMLRQAALACVDALRYNSWVAIGGASLPWLAARGDANDSPRRYSRLAWLAAGLFILGYAPFIPSDYMPNGVNLMNRMNIAAALAVALAACAAASARPRLRLPLCAAASLAIVSAVGFSRLWAESYKRQLAIRDVVLRLAPLWPEDRTLLVYIPERFVRDKVMIFDAHWDIGGAVQIWMNDPRRAADMISHRIEPRPKALVVRGVPYPYSKFTVLDVPNRRIAPASYEILKQFPRT